jgi:hypothetical protein
MLLAEIASCQVEYKYLSHVTGKEDYFRKVTDCLLTTQLLLNLNLPLQAENVARLMHEGQLDNGMWDTIWDINSGKQVNSKCSFNLDTRS